MCNGVAISSPNHVAEGNLFVRRDEASTKSSRRGNGGNKLKLELVIAVVGVSNGA